MDRSLRAPMPLSPLGEPPLPATLKRLNMRRFVDELRHRGPSTRADLARITGVSAPTSSKAILELQEMGLLEPVPEPASTKGRPAILYRLATRTAYLLAGVIRERECAVMPGNLDGTLAPHRAVRFPTPERYEELLARLASAVQEVEDGHGGHCLGLGLSVPGLLNEARGQVVFSPNAHLLDGRLLTDDLQALVSPRVVCVQADHGLCLAEQALGQARSLRDFAVIDLASGLGLGIVSGGRYVGGQSGFAGGLGHVTVEPEGILCGCGNRGCLQKVASDDAFVSAVSARLGRAVTMEEVVRMAQSDELDVRTELDRTLGYLAIGVAAVINLLNPAAIFINGALFDADDGAFHRLVEAVRRRGLRPSVAHCSLIRAQANDALGALSYAIEDVLASVGPKLA